MKKKSNEKMSSLHVSTDDNNPTLLGASRLLRHRPDVQCSSGILLSGVSLYRQRSTCSMFTPVLSEVEILQIRDLDDVFTLPLTGLLPRTRGLAKYLTFSLAAMVLRWTFFFGYFRGPQTWAWTWRRSLEFGPYRYERVETGWEGRGS
jgi:hypothetical protein